MANTTIEKRVVYRNDNGTLKKVYVETNAEQVVVTPDYNVDTNTSGIKSNNAQDALIEIKDRVVTAETTLDQNVIKSINTSLTPTEGNVDITLETLDKNASDRLGAVETKAADNATNIANLQTAVSKNNSNYTFATKQDMIDKLTAGQENYLKGDNLFIIQNDEPDYWIVDINDAALPDPNPNKLEKYGNITIAKIEVDTQGIKNNTANIAKLNKELYSDVSAEQKAVKQATNVTTTINNINITDIFEADTNTSGATTAVVKDATNAENAQKATQLLKEGNIGNVNVVDIFNAADDGSLVNKVKEATAADKIAVPAKITFQPAEGKAGAGHITGNFTTDMSANVTVQNVQLTKIHNLTDSQGVEHNVYSSCPVVNAQGVVVDFQDAIMFGATIADNTAPKGLMIGGLYFEEIK